MWIGKKERDQIVADRDSAVRECHEWKAKYKAITEDAVMFCDNDTIILSTKVFNQILEPAEQAKAALDTLRAELESWKQKYADEVQKRLALIEQMKG